MRTFCLVIPCFNEERRLRRGDFVAFLAGRADASLCFVDDGSRDDTWGMLQALQAEYPSRIAVLRLESNGGKAEAVRAGVRRVAAERTVDAIGYWDADLSTPLAEADHLLDALRERPACVLALASRVKRLGARVERRFSRHVMGRLFATMATLTLGLTVYDSQCGAKLMRAEDVASLFADPFVTRWMFDLEILMRLKNQRGQLGVAAIEVPIGEWCEVGGSKLKLVDMLRVPFLFLKIRSQYRRR